MDFSWNYWRQSPLSDNRDYVSPKLPRIILAATRLRMKLRISRTRRLWETLRGKEKERVREEKRAGDSEKLTR